MSDESVTEADKDLLIGVDVGTTNVKATAYTVTGQPASATSQGLPTEHPRPGWSQYPLETLLDTAAAVLQELATRIDVRRVRGIAVTSMAETAAPLDSRGVPLHPALAWHDQRGVAEAEWFGAQICADRLHAITGLGPRHIFGLYKLLWLRANVAQAAELRRWLNVADYVAFWLSGEQATDPSLATRTSLFDLRSGQWSNELLAAAGLQESLFAPIAESGTCLGSLTAEAAEATGLPRHTQVAVGGHDHPCGALGLGLLDGSALLDSIGTAESVFALLAEPAAESGLASSGYEQGRYVVPGTYYVMGGIYTSGATIDWAAEILGLQGADRHQRLVELAAQAEPGAGGVLFLPHLRMANPPHNDAHSRASFVGMTDETGQAELARAVVEGLAYEFALTYGGLRSHFGVDAREVVVTGGGSANVLGLGIKAALLGVPLQVAVDEQATARGAAMLAGVGAGVFADARAAVKSMRCATAEPPAGGIGETPAYREIYERRYRPLYHQLAEIHHAVSSR